MQLSRSDLLRARRTMQAIRSFDDRVRLEKARGHVPGDTQLSAGREASATGVCVHLPGVDRIASTDRGHGHATARQCEIGGTMAEILGRSTRTCHGRAGADIMRPASFIEDGPTMGSRWAHVRAPRDLQLEVVSSPHGRGLTVSPARRLWQPAVPAA